MLLVVELNVAIVPVVALTLLAVATPVILRDPDPLKVPVKESLASALKKLSELNPARLTASTLDTFAPLPLND